MNIILFGPPAVGKGTQSKLIAKKYNLPQLSTGDMLREAIAQGSEIGRKVSKIMTSGELVSDEIIMDVIKHRLSCNDCASGVIFDGFPRTKSQGESLHKIFMQMGKKIDYIIELSVDFTVLIDRVKARVSQTAPADRRPDDNPEILKKRLEVYEAQTAPVLDYYRGLGKLITLDGALSIESVSDKIFAIIDCKVK